MSIKGTFLLSVFRKSILARKDMDVDEHERLINFTLSKAQMFCRSLFFRLYNFHTFNHLTIISLRGKVWTHKTSLIPPSLM
jgi:hypothetical protein